MVDKKKVEGPKLTRVQRFEQLMNEVNKKRLIAFEAVKAWESEVKKLNDLSEGEDIFYGRFEEAGPTTVDRMEKDATSVKSVIKRQDADFQWLKKFLRD